MPKSILKRLKKEQTPLIDGNVATFVWSGESAPYLVGDFTNWEAGNPAIMAELKPGVWTYQLTLPLDAYIEYSFLLGEESLPDPFNPRQSSNGVGGYNHYFHMPGYIPTSLIQKKSDALHGTVTKHVIPTDHFVFGTQRTIHLYHPPVDGAVPLIVFWDGQDYLRRVHLNIIVDNLIAERRIQPLALAFVNNGGSTARAIECACNDSTLVFLMTKILPLATTQLNLLDINQSPGAFGVAGSSMGGLMALYTSARIPQVFGNVLSQSGAFSLAGFDMVVFDLLEHADQRSLKIWLDVGMYDIPELLTANLRMKNMLEQEGYKVDYHEYHAGHNYPAWRDDIWRGLEALYGFEK